MNDHPVRTGARSLRLPVAWLVISVLALMSGIGSFPLIEPDEGRNAEVAREMAFGPDCTAAILLP